MRKKKETTKPEPDLIGIKPICNYVQKDASTVFQWREIYGFPIDKIDTQKTFMWTAHTKDIDEFFLKRNVTPEAVTLEKLEAYKLEELQKAGKIKPLNQTLEGIDKIADFCNLSIATVYNWPKYWDDCPIQKNKDGILFCDCDKLLAWMKKYGFKV